MGSIPWISFVLSPTLLSLWMFISLDLMLLLNKTKSHVIFYLVISMVNARHEWNGSKSLTLSCLRQLIYVSLVPCFYLGPPLLTPNLVTTFACYPSFAWCMLLCIPISTTWELLWVVGSVMVPRLAIYDAATKPRASYGGRHKVVLLGMCWYWDF